MATHRELPGGAFPLGIPRFPSARLRGPSLTREEERELAGRACAGDTAAREALVEANLRFVAKIAWEYRDRGMPLEDLVGEGTLGMVQAAQRFDPARGTRFITFAVWWIRKAILIALRERGRLVRLPEYQARKAREALESARAALERQRGHADPWARQLEASGGAGGDVHILYHQTTISLTSESGGEGRTLADRLPANIPSPEEALLRSEARGRLTAAMQCLSWRERVVLAHRFGLEETPLLPYHRIGQLLGISHERARQIEVDARERLRGAL